MNQKVAALALMLLVVFAVVLTVILLLGLSQLQLGRATVATSNTTQTGNQVYPMRPFAPK